VTPCRRGRRVVEARVDASERGTGRRLSGQRGALGSTGVARLRSYHVYPRQFLPAEGQAQSRPREAGRGHHHLTRGGEFSMTPPGENWVTVDIRSVLFNSLYKGEVVWGRSKKRDAWGRRKESDRPTNEWVITSAEHLRIVS